MLPLVSKVWRGLLGGTSSAWEIVSIDANVDFRDGVVQLDTVGMSLWFCRHAGSIRTLRVVGYLPMLSFSMLSSILMSQSASLRDLHISFENNLIAPAELAVLATLTALERLSIFLPYHRRDKNVWMDDGGSVLLRVISSLPALVFLEFNEDQDIGCTLVSSLSTLAKLQSSTLTSFYINYCNLPHESVLTLGDLPRLITFEIELVTYNNEALHVPEDAFEGVLSLAELAISCSSSMLLLAPTCLGKLTMLTVLGLRYCSLQVVPEALLGVKASLRQLDLSCNPDLQISQAGFDTLLALPSLKVIDLRKDAVSWDVDSSRFLVSYLSVRHGMYPGSVQPTLHV